MAQLIDLADALTAALNAQFGGSFTASRVWVPQFTLEQIGALQVAVRPHGQKGRIIDRKPTRQMEYRADVGFVQRFQGPVDVASKAQADALATLVESVADYAVKTVLAVGSPAVAAVPTDVENDPAYDPKLLDELGEFLSVLTVSYAVFR